MTPPLDAFVFDAYGTLFDVNSVAALAETLAPSNGAALSRLWRTKQLEYSWLQSLMATPAHPREDFGAVTAHALDYAIAALMLTLDDAARRQLLDAYRRLAPFPDALETLRALAPRPRIILSNGTREMLVPLVEVTGLRTALDDVLSVDDAGIFKPSPAVYRLATARLGLPPERIGFVSSNGWDAAGAKAFGFTTFWINRDGVPTERHAAPPDFILGSLTAVAQLAATPPR
ncbi:MAG: haloacid dehalogenase type II [Betaproteobacteria bacterium]